MKRVLSLLLTLVMVAGLFAGLAVPVSANDELGSLLDKYLTGDKIDELFDESQVVKTGSCGKDGQANVLYKLYRVDPEKVKALTSDTSILEQNEAFQKLREKFPDFKVDGQNVLQDLEFDLPDDQDYYAVKLSGSGEMEDYTLTKRSPWSGETTVKIDGQDVNVDLEEQLIAAYVEGPNTGKSFKGVANVGRRAFFGQDRLMLVYLGESVKAIGEKAFETCDALCAINFPSALESIGRRAFYACDYLTFARMTSCTKLTKIEERAFCTCSRLTSVWFPHNITEIGEFAFAWDHLLGTEEFALPANLKKIDTGAFAFCTHLGAVNELVIPASVSVIEPWAFACGFDISALQINGGATPLVIGNGAFAGARALKEITFPNRVTNIGKYAFAACDSLERVIMQDKSATDSQILTIQDRAFVSLEATGLKGIKEIALKFKEAGSDDAEYVDGSRQIAERMSEEVDQLTGVTPLKAVAWNAYPGNVESADQTAKSFPETAVIYYPAQDYNAGAYSAWTASAKMNMVEGTWNKYPCEPTWVGHYHVYGDPEIVERTCTQDGLEIYTCTVWQDGKQCGHQDVVVTEKATGHNAKLVQSTEPTCTEDGVGWYECSNPWCTQKKYSEVLPATGHDLEHLTGGDYKAPTCLEAGYAKGTCPVCGVYLNETIPAKGHNIEFLECIKEADCEHEGVYQGNCPDCGRTNVRQTVPALGHEWDDGTILKPATDTTDGSIRYVCERCGQARTEVIPKKIHTHQYVDTVIPATCETEGYTNHKCSLCGDEYKDSFVPAGHKWDAGVVRTEPTATKEGMRVYTCTVCGSHKNETIPATGVKFVDVPADAYFAPAVNWAVSKSPAITSGTSATTFSPNDPCTRAQAVAFLYRAAGEPTVSGANPFYDVKTSDYFYNAVLWAVSKGITKGTDDTHFSPNDPCTRAHIVTFLYRAKGSPNVTAQSNPFRDVPVGQWYTLPVLWAVNNDITKGTGATTFSPNDTCTRGQIVTFLYRDRNS